jgi:hypothetical protein
VGFLLNPKAVNCLGYHRKSELKTPNAHNFIGTLVKIFLAIQQNIEYFV